MPGDSNAPNSVVPIGADLETQVDSCVPETSAQSNRQLKQFVTMSSELTFKRANGELSHADWTPAHETFADFKSNAIQQGSKPSQETFANGKFVNRSAQVLHSLPIAAASQLPHKVQGDVMLSSDASATDSQRSCCSEVRSIVGAKNLREEPLNDVDERLLSDRAHHRSIANLNNDRIYTENYVVPCWIKQEEDACTAQASLSSCRLSQKSEFREVVNEDASILITPDIVVSSIIDHQTIKQEVEDEHADDFGIFPDSPYEHHHEPDSINKFHNDISNQSRETNAVISSQHKLDTKQNANNDSKFVLINQKHLGYTGSVDEAFNDDHVVGECADTSDGLDVLPNFSQVERFGIKNCSVVLKPLSISKWQRFDDELRMIESGLTRVKTQTGETAVVRSVCGKLFVQELRLKLQKKIHTDKKAYSCLHCGREFGFLSHLKVHERIHTGEKPYPCSSCGKTFRCLANLNLHERIHTGEKPYACSHCGKTFKGSANRNLHERIHTGEKPYMCSHCGKKFVSSSDQKRHERIHTG